MAHYSQKIIGPLLGYLNSTKEPVTLFFEPGRTVLEPFGAMLTTVVGGRPAAADGIKGVILDAGLSSLAKADSFSHPVHVCKAGVANETTRFFGPSCRERDVVHKPMLVPSLNVGDHLVFYGVGAYSMAASNSFIHFRHGVLMWEQSGKLKWLRKPENLEHVQQVRGDSLGGCPRVPFFPSRTT